MKRGAVYLITNRYHNVLYVGSTVSLRRRLLEHQSGFYGRSFSRRYNVDKLVYYRWFETLKEAREEEKRIKGGNRRAKEKLVRPSWRHPWRSASGQLHGVRGRA
ncbi:MAG: GIY-YIG nuclease family protein [Chitinophagaceae bacterium]